MDHGSSEEVVVFFFDFAGGFGGDFFWTDFSFVTELMNEITARKTVVNDSC